MTVAVAFSILVYIWYIVDPCFVVGPVFTRCIPSGDRSSLSILVVVVGSAALRLISPKKGYFINLVHRLYLR